MIRLVYIQELVLDLPSYNDVKVLVPDTTIPHVQQSIEVIYLFSLFLFCLILIMTMKHYYLFVGL